ncbi:MAG TPA: Tad domain-containing protein [Longimicrobiaceae bacterium]|nr:Tad domain-containing protein [Longimicrobiaceae bacterium]
MRRRRESPVRNERGATMVFMALGTLTLLGVCALAVDVGLMYNTRAEAQRAADSGALAGASALMDEPDPTRKVAEARARAVRFAGLNHMASQNVPSTGVGVEMLEADTRVRVTVGSGKVPMLFARLLGTNTVPVSASADAVAAATGTGKCLKPFALPNYAYTPENYGKRILLWTTKSDSLVLIGPAVGPIGGGALQKIIADPGCMDGIMTVNDEPPYDVPGEKVGQVMNGVQNLIDLDPTLAYEEGKGFHRNGTPEPNWRKSPRVANIALYDPAELDLSPGGGKTLDIDNFAAVFFEEVTKGSVKEAWGRIFPAIGVGDNCAATNSCSTNTFYLRLVK